MVHLPANVFFELTIVHGPQFFGTVDSEFLSSANDLEGDRDRDFADLFVVRDDRS